MQLVLVMPVTNATSERSFSALRRVKSYLRSTTGQERLNYLMLLHVHSDKTDKQDLKSVLNDFILPIGQQFFQNFNLFHCLSSMYVVKLN